MAKIETKIGKDVIESLTLGMYEDPRFIFREYIQNSADQIDKAVEDGLLNSLDEGRIEIEINTARKSISIRDNATGIEKGKVSEILKNIAQSTKDRTKNKGFRGIGRLGGLAYCDKLTFETSFKGESSKSILLWDAKELKSIINDRSKKEEASFVIDAVTKTEIENEKEAEHYFIVTLHNVSNLDLLNKSNIYEYLSMVAPVKYSKGFIYKDKIYSKAAELENVIDEYPVFVNRDQVYKDYTTSIYKGEKGNKSKIDEIYDIENFEIRTNKNKLLAWGWFSISKFEKAMPSINLARSIRLRKGNIQVGLEDALTKLFKEPRGTKYFFGEIHVVSPDLIPNSRRDYFLDSEELKEFEKLVRVKFEELHKLYYFSSKIRNGQKKIDDLVSFKDEYNLKLKKEGFTDENQKKDYQEKFDQKKEKAQQAEKEIEKIKEKKDQITEAQQKVLQRVTENSSNKVGKVSIKKDIGKTKFATDDITSLNRKERKLVSRIFVVIDNVLPKDIANILKEKIKEEMQ